MEYSWQWGWAHSGMGQQRNSKELPSQLVPTKARSLEIHPLGPFGGKELLYHLWTLPCSIPTPLWGVSDLGFSVQLVHIYGNLANSDRCRASYISFYLIHSIDSSRDKSSFFEIKGSHSLWETIEETGTHYSENSQDKCFQLSLTRGNLDHRLTLMNMITILPSIRVMPSCNPQKASWSWC